MCCFYHEIALNFKTRVSKIYNMHSFQMIKCNGHYDDHDLWIKSSYCLCTRSDNLWVYNTIFTG